MLGASLRDEKHEKLQEGKHACPVGISMPKTCLIVSFICICPKIETFAVIPSVCITIMGYRCVEFSRGYSSSSHRKKIRYEYCTPEFFMADQNWNNTCFPIYFEMQHDWTATPKLFSSVCLWTARILQKQKQRLYNRYGEIKKHCRSWFRFSATNQGALTYILKTWIFLEHPVLKLEYPRASARKIENYKLNTLSSFHTIMTLKNWKIYLLIRKNSSHRVLQILNFTLCSDCTLRALFYTLYICPIFFKTRCHKPVRNHCFLPHILHHGFSMDIMYSN